MKRSAGGLLTAALASSRCIALADDFAEMHQRDASDDAIDQFGFDRSRANAGAAM